MKKLFWECVGLGFLVCIGWIGFNLYSTAQAQTVFTRQSPGIGGSVLTNAAFSDLNPQVAPAAGSDWLGVSTQRTYCWDIDLVDANSSITSIDMYCYTSRDYTGAANKYRLPVFTSTSVAGVTTSMPSIIRQVSTAGLAPGTSSWSWCVTNIPGPYLSCSFLANGVITAGIDTISVFGRGVTP